MKFTVINKNNDFVRIYTKGRQTGCRTCTAYFRKNGLKVTRLGISTSKKMGNAVARSRARRVIREAYRQNYSDIPKGYDIVITARAAAAECKSYTVSTFIAKSLIPAMMSGGKKGGENWKNGKSSKKQN